MIDGLSLLLETSVVAENGQAAATSPIAALPLENGIEVTAAGNRVPQCTGEIAVVDALCVPARVPPIQRTKGRAWR